MKMLMIVPMIAVALSTGFLGCEPRNDDIAKVEPKAGDSNSDLAKSIEAQRLAQATEGVKRVDNRLEVNT